LDLTGFASVNGNNSFCICISGHFGIGSIQTTNLKPRAVKNNIKKYLQRDRFIGNTKSVHRVSKSKLNQYQNWGNTSKMDITGFATVCLKQPF
jgi:hypothetical protein